MNDLLQFFKGVQELLWGIPLLALLIGAGIYLTIVLKGIQFRYLSHVFRFSKEDETDTAKGDITPFQSVMTATASAVGTGSIVGVAIAISTGGLGSVFWLWITSIISMAIKYAESLLAVKYRIIDDKNEMAGGPMYYMERGLGWKKLAMFFAMTAAIAAIGTGNLVQVNSIASAIHNVYDITPFSVGFLLTVVTGFVLFGGIHSIGQVAAIMVPFMALLYIVSGIYVLIEFNDRILDAISLIFSSAFSGQAAYGGFLGASVMMAIRTGVSRSLFCSEAGLGISSIAAAAARTNSSNRQALMSMAVTLLSTAVICTITALVIAVTGSFGELDANGIMLNGARLVIHAFNQALPIGQHIVTFGLVLFAYSTVIAWAYYGEKCCEYMFGTKGIIWYRLLYIALILPGALFALEVVWSFADIMNALMIFPNIIALLRLSKIVQKETNVFLSQEHNTLEQKKTLNPASKEPSLRSTVREII